MCSFYVFPHIKKKGRLRYYHNIRVSDKSFVATLCLKVESVAVRLLALPHTAAACVIQVQAAAVQR